jgi:methionyl-tRNA formyltransferase
MRLVFAGTPDFAVPPLRALQAAGHRIELVLTQPDRPGGRGMSMRLSAVKQAALALGLAVFQPASLKGAEVGERLRAAAPEALVVVAYGLILPPQILAIPAGGAINIHASLLPRWRGAAPIQRALLAGDRETGICIMRMDEGLDTGPVLMRLPLAIRPGETCGSLHDRLAELGAQGIVQVLRGGAAGIPAGIAQPEAGVTYAHKIGKRDSLLDWEAPAEQIERIGQAFDPVPGAAAGYRGQPLKFWGLKPVAERTGALPGTVLQTEPALLIACGGGSVVSAAELQRPGGRRLPAGSVVHGLGLRAGERLEPAPAAGGA